MDEIKPIFKQFELKAEVAENSLRGNANALGIMDRGGDVIAPGAFKKVLPSFLEKGFMPVGHDWESLPVGYFTWAAEKDGFLQIAATYHSDEVAQRARTVVKERAAAGKFVGLSIGFQVDDESCAFFETGKAMAKHLDDHGGLMGFDEKSIKAWKGRCRLISGVKELFEVSIVTVPMNQFSGVTAAKSSAALPHASTDEGEPHGRALSFANHSSQALAALEEFVTRAEDLSSKRALDGRQLSAAHRESFRALADRLLVLATLEIDDAAERAMATHLAQRARLQKARLGAA